MNRLRVIVSGGFDPVLNLATEDWLFSELEPGIRALYLWRNRDVVVIGRNQNPWKECDLDAMRRDGVVLMRRTTGGGAVFHDIGNLNFTFLSPSEEYDRTKNNGIILRALGRFGIEAEASGRNDILAAGKKVSGSAYRETKEKCFHHGTLLIRADLGKLARYLTPDRRKLSSKGVESVRSRVGNLADFSPTIDYEPLRDALVDEIFAEYGGTCPVETLDSDYLEREPSLAEAYARLSSDEWRLGRTPEFTHELSTKFDWGSIDVLLTVKNGKIESALVYSDCLDADFPAVLKTALESRRYGPGTAGEVSEALASAGTDASRSAEMRLWLADVVG